MSDRPSGFSLVEILIGLVLLVLATGTVVVVFQSAGRETAFSSEHYTAMFLAQKVFEDINSMIRDNPHSFTTLVQDAEGREEPVVNGGSKYFRLLGNTRNFGYLSPEDDHPITKGPLFEQLKAFTVQVSSKIEPHPLTGEVLNNCLKVVVSVRWTTKEGAKREYQVSQFVHGESDDVFQQPLDLSLSPSKQGDLDKGAARVLAGLLGIDPATVESPANINPKLPGSSLDAAMNLGRIVWLTRSAKSMDESFQDEMKALENARDEFKKGQSLEERLRFFDIQRKIGQILEQKALRQIGFLLSMKHPIEDLVEALKANPVNHTSGGALGIALYPACYPAIDRALTETDIIFKLVPASLGTSEKAVFTLLEPPYLELIPPRQEPSFFRKSIDIQKLGILRQENDPEAQRILDTLNMNIDLFAKKYRGKFPHFEEFLRQEKTINKDLSTLRSHYRTIHDVFMTLSLLEKAFFGLRQLIPKP